jgi:NADPH2:quinone reductase
MVVCGGGGGFRLLRKRAAIKATTLRSRSKAYKADLVERFRQAALPKLENGTFRWARVWWYRRGGVLVPHCCCVRVVVDTTFPLADAGAAHALVERNANTGKVLLQVASDVAGRVEL